jgi:hypothetical protein
MVNKVYDLVSEMLDYAELVCADPSYPDYSLYQIEVKHVKFCISAKKVTGTIANPYWVIRDFSTSTD